MSIDNNRPGLRAVRPEDEPFLYYLFSLVKGEELGVGHWDEAQREQLLRMQFNAYQQHHRSDQGTDEDRIVTLDEQAIGRLIVQRTASAIMLADVSLLPEFRNQGIGTRLVGELQEEARQTNRPLRLHVFKTNRAFGFYRRLGFEVVTSSDTQELMEWKPAPDDGVSALREAP